MTSTLRVRAMGPADLAAAADLLAEAFADGTNLASFVPERGRRERLRRFFTVAGEVDVLVHGVAEVAVSGVGAHERLLAVAWWHPPRAVEAAAPVSWSWREVPSALAVFGVRRLLAVARSRRASERARPAAAHRHLAYLASRPDPAARGAASALLVHRLAQADAEGVGSHLESSSVATVGFYERFGWRVSGLVDGPGGRRTTAMWRPAGGA